MQRQNVTEIIENCRYCLMCRHVCPVGHVTRKETLTPHGWGLTIASVQRGLLTWNPEVVAVLYSCADCGTCRAFCVTDQALPDAIAATRAEVTAQNLAPAAAYEINEALQEWSNPYEKQVPETVNGQAEIALFVGDDAKYLRPATLESVLKLLEAVGVKPVLVGVGRSNGYLASSLGFPETAKMLVQTTLDELKASGARRMLVLTPGDYYAFNRLLTDRLEIEWPLGVELQEVISLLDKKFTACMLKFKSSDDKRPYAYIDPTNSLRIPVRFEAPRRLLAGIMPTTGRELFWRKERAHPCGNGALQFSNPHISNHLTYARLADAQEIGAQILITEDPGGLSHLSRHADRFGLHIQDLYEILANHLL
ncbi:MAG: (Fe-S)-binding protein [Anaerolineales bacterium]